MIITVKMVYKHYVYLSVFFMSTTLRLLLSRNIVGVLESAAE